MKQLQNGSTHILNSSVSSRNDLKCNQFLPSPGVPCSLCEKQPSFFALFAPSGEALIARAQMPWAGHVAQTAGVQMPKQLLYHGLMLGKRGHSCQEKNIRASLKHYLE